MSADIILGLWIGLIIGLIIPILLNSASRFLSGLSSKYPLMYYSKNFYDPWDKENKPKGWYYSDITKVGLIGPYKKKREAKKAYKKHCLLEKV